VVTYAAVARANPDRGVVITDVDGKYQAYSWDRASGTIGQVTSSDSAVISAAISRDGHWIYTLVEDKTGAEVGHIHGFPFAGGPSVDLTPELEPYSVFLFEPSDRNLVALVGISGGQSLLVVDEDRAKTFPLPSFPRDMVASREGETAAVTLATPGSGLVPMVQVIDLDTGEVRLEEPGTIAGGIRGDRLAVARVEDGWLRPAIRDAQDFQPIDVEIPGDLVPVDWSDDGSTILIAQTYRSKSGLFLYDLVRESITELPTPPGGAPPGGGQSLVAADRALFVWSDANHPWRVFESSPEKYELALNLEGQHTFPGPQWEEFTFPSVGGAEIQGWLLRPEGEGPWPTVVYTHGGPSSVAGPIFSPIGSAWFDRGFAVASVNYRGSTTFGESFREALTGNIGGPDVDDVVAAHHWLVDNGIADPDRVIKNGYSYGGYLTLQVLGTHPDLWAAGVAGAPIADWSLNYEDSNDLLKGYDLSLFGGPPEELPESYAKASPRTYVSQYQAPVLISQPENDSRTPMRQVAVFVDDMEAAGKDVELRVLEGGHAGSGIEQMIEMVESWLDFADRVI
jgi:dienelactone hydrolase